MGGDTAPLFPFNPRGKPRTPMGTRSPGGATPVGKRVPQPSRMPAMRSRKY